MFRKTWKRAFTDLELSLQWDNLVNEFSGDLQMMFILKFVFILFNITSNAVTWKRPTGWWVLPWSEPVSSPLSGSFSCASLQVGNSCEKICLLFRCNGVHFHPHRLPGCRIAAWLLLIQPLQDLAIRWPRDQQKHLPGVFSPFLHFYCWILQLNWTPEIIDDFLKQKNTWLAFTSVVGILFLVVVCLFIFLWQRIRIAIALIEQVLIQLYLAFEGV